MIETNPMGPGFFIFFQDEVETSGGWEPYKYRKRVRFKYADEEEEKAAPIIERIAEKVLDTKEVETKQDIELVLRLRLEQEGLIYKNLYLVWLINQTKVERQREESVIMLLLH